MFFEEKNNYNVFDLTIKNTITKKEFEKFFSGLKGKLNVKKITNLNSNKTPGHSDLPAWALKDGCKEI